MPDKWCRSYWNGSGIHRNLRITNHPEAREVANIGLGYTNALGRVGDGSTGHARELGHADGNQMLLHIWVDNHDVQIVTTLAQQCLAGQHSVGIQVDGGCINVVCSQCTCSGVSRPFSWLMILVVIFGSYPSPAGCGYWPERRNRFERLKGRPCQTQHRASRLGICVLACCF